MKKINELFDDEFQRDNSGDANYDLKKTRNLSPVLRYLNKIFFEIPVIEKCINNPDKNHFINTHQNLITFIVRNEKYHVSVTFHFEQFNNANVCILWQKSDYTGDIFVSLYDDDVDYCHIGDFELLTSDGSVDVLKNNFVPLLKK
jgi:hypothetical protein